MRENEEILIHACCGPCSTASIERLLEDGWKPTIFYSDSNIYPESEFAKRYENLVLVCQHYKIPLLFEEQDHKAWLSAIHGFETEREGGKRCSRCFEYNLNRAYLKAKELGFRHFSTTLTVSRFKNSSVIFSIGEKFEGFEPIDFKKKGGFEKSCRLSKEMGLYRQQYCGCEFSLSTEF
ncbi:MAG: epoxyqueuosine reductase QueH [Sphaerochaetaceae bacterium]|jgi:predicted adenine nucleotide alpha hydrolase (AANH) superfamily ATPase